MLINGGSASSSEIVAAALQDVGRAVVVGSASYGKGTVQTVLRLPNDGELTLTWAQLVAPSGYSCTSTASFRPCARAISGTTTARADSDAARGGVTRGRAGAHAAARVARRSRPGLQLRRSCPARQGDHEIDVKVAKRLLADPVLYSQAVHAIAGRSERGGGSGRRRPADEPALTGASPRVIFRSTQSLNARVARWPRQILF